MARNFNEILGEIDGGLLQQLLSEKLAEVVRNVGDVEKPGTLTLKLGIKPNGEGKVFIDAKVEAKSPEKPVDTSMFYATPTGDLSRRDPEQEAKLGIRAVG